MSDQITERIFEAKWILAELGFPPAQSNERSALTLLALLDLDPDMPWTAASTPLRGITEMMTHMSVHYGKDYAPNTRETVRRQTIHQFCAPKRRAELDQLLQSPRLGLVYVTAFSDRATFRQYVADIAWESEVWIAESPDHLIHFDGSKFLGPYD